MRSLRSLLSSVPAALLVALAAAACTNEASTEPGDQPADAGKPTTLGNGLRIADINTPEAGFAAETGVQQNVTVTGATFLVKDTYAEDGLATSVGNIYVQDFTAPDAAGVPYSGMELYKSVLEPASLVLAPGDVIDFNGEYERSFCAAPGECFYGPEMYEPDVTFRFDYTPPSPTLIPVSDLETTATGNAWYFMLVQIQDTYGGGWIEGSKPGECSVFLTSDTGQMGVAMDNSLFDLPCSSGLFNPDAGVVHFKSVTGIVNNYGNFRIEPRSMDDIVIGD